MSLRLSLPAETAPPKPRYRGLFNCLLNSMLRARSIPIGRR